MTQIVISQPSTLLVPAGTREDGYFLAPSIDWIELGGISFSLTPLKGPRSLSLVDLRENGEKYISIQSIAKKTGICGEACKKFTPLSVNHGRTLMMHGLVPEDWKTFQLVFAGTRYKGPDGVKYLPCAYWNKADDFYTRFLPYTEMVGPETRVVMSVDSTE